MSPLQQALLFQPREVRPNGGRGHAKRGHKLVHRHLALSSENLMDGALALLHEQSPRFAAVPPIIHFRLFTITTEITA
jgi:hypothetical protein